MYGPWTPAGEFDWSSYENLVRTVLLSGSVPATNVDTTWAIYNEPGLARELVWRTAEIATGEGEKTIAADRPLLVAGLNTNPYELDVKEIATALREQIAEIDAGLRQRGATRRVRYMPVPDRRLLAAPRKVKLRTYREIGAAVSEFTDFGMVFFELDIGIPGFGSDFTLDEIAEILAETPAIQEYKSALISRKAAFHCLYDYCDDLRRIRVVEQVAPGRVQFSTGNDWFISLARYGARIKRHGYLLGASMMSPYRFQLWREFVKAGKPCALSLEQDLQAAAKDFWTPGNVGIYRHYLAIFLAMTRQIAHPLPHPRCEARYRVQPEDYFIPLRHALRLGLADSSDARSIVRHIIPGGADWSESEIERRVALMS